ncbi:unnamed protein product, partial [Ectocarpus sp. 8 AP-2014]
TGCGGGGGSRHAVLDLGSPRRPAARITAGLASQHHHGDHRHQDYRHEQTLPAPGRRRQKQQQRQLQQGRHAPTPGKQRQQRRQRRLASSSSSPPSCSPYTGDASSVLTDPDWGDADWNDDDGTYYYSEFSCGDGEFLVEAEPSMLEHSYTSMRDTYSVKLVQSIRWTCSDGSQSQSSEDSGFSTSGASSTWTPTYGAATSSAFTAAVTGVSARYLPYPDCATMGRGGTITDTDRCYHFGHQSFTGDDVLDGVAYENSVGLFGDDGYFDETTTTAVDTYTVCDPNSYATGFFMWRDGEGMLELQLRCAEYVPGICGTQGSARGRRRLAKAETTRARTSTTEEKHRHRQLLRPPSSATPPTTTTTPIGRRPGGSKPAAPALLVGAALPALIAAVLVCLLLKACIRKTCCGFGEYDGNWDTAAESDQDGFGRANGNAGGSGSGGGGGGAGQVGVGGSWARSGD